MTSGALSLADYPGDVIALACSKCDRRGRYSKGRLVAAHGRVVGLPNLLTRIAADCPRQRDPLGNDRCGAHYPGFGQR